jgi:hypothetical protein
MIAVLLEWSGRWIGGFRITNVIGELSNGVLRCR